MGIILIGMPDLPTGLKTIPSYTFVRYIKHFFNTIWYRPIQICIPSIENKMAGILFCFPAILLIVSADKMLLKIFKPEYFIIFGKSFTDIHLQVLNGAF